MKKSCDTTTMFMCSTIVSHLRLHTTGAIYSASCDLRCSSCAESCGFFRLKIKRDDIVKLGTLFSNVMHKYHKQKSFWQHIERKTTQREDDIKAASLRRSKRSRPQVDSQSLSSANSSLSSRDSDMDPSTQHFLTQLLQQQQEHHKDMMSALNASNKPHNNASPNPTGYPILRTPNPPPLPAHVSPQLHPQKK